MDTSDLDPEVVRLQRSEIQEEQRAVRRTKRAIDRLVNVAGPIWHWGDGYGGYVYELIAGAVRRVGLETPPVPSPPTKARIQAKLRRAVFERDAYRCRSCGGWSNLQIDHVIPESEGGSTTFDNLQALCRSCNTEKGPRPWG